MRFRTWAMKVCVKSHWMHELFLWVPCPLSNRWRRRVLGMSMSWPHIRMMVSSSINEDLIFSLWTQGFWVVASFTSWPWRSIKASRYSCHGASSTVQWLLSNILEKWIEKKQEGKVLVKRLHFLLPINFALAFAVQFGTFTPFRVSQGYEGFSLDLERYASAYSQTTF